MKKRLFKSILLTSYLLITFFSCIAKTSAASFSYDSFNWDNFLAQHKGYWVSYCDEGDEECYDVLIKTQKKFYTRLYSLLATYEKKKYVIDDNIIIETVYFGLTPGSFRDEDTAKEEYDGQKIDYAYKVDESEKKQKYIASDDGDRPGAQEYFRKETDSLKTLMNNMIGYTQICYGVSNEPPQMVTHEDGSTSLECGGTFVLLDGKCVEQADLLKSNFFDSIGLWKIFGNSNEKKCEDITKEKYPSYLLGDVNPKEVNEELYWDFLTNNDYFDNKFQLQHYFETILNETNHKKMSELTDEEYEKYNDDIVAARKRIIEGINDIIKSYGEFAETPTGMSTASKTNYWWPIGSNDTTSEGETIMATGDPSSVSVSSNFGKRVTPKTGMHYGVDISGEVNSTNVIAASNGVVVYSSKTNNDNCPDSSDLSSTCGGGYGNYVVLQHSDGNYTLYGHLAQNSIVVENGDSVKQGQVLGKVGSSGSSTGAHLHFEVRVGGNASSNSVDPLTYISATNARATGSSSNLIEFIHSWEGAPKESGDNYIAFDDGYGNVTIGWGVVPKFNAERFQDLGVNANTIYVGSTVPKNVVDQVEQQELQGAADSIRSTLSNSGITLEDYQVDALISRKYNTGNIKGFADAYKKYGNTQALYDNYMSTPIKASGQVSQGLIRRRQAEWELFSKGNYMNNS